MAMKILTLPFKLLILFMEYISGFSKLSKTEKIEWLTENFFQDAKEADQLIRKYWNRDEKLQRLHDEFSENTISNYYLPFGIAPNFKINGKPYEIGRASCRERRVRKEWV